MIIFGRGAHARTAYDAVIAAGIGPGDITFVVDSIYLGVEKSYCDSLLIAYENISELDTYSSLVNVAIGENLIRQRIATRFNSLNKYIKFGANIVHPTAVVSSQASLGKGVFVGAFAYVGPGAKLGDGVIVNTGALVEHDCILGDFSFIGPNTTLGGHVVVGERTFLGMSSTVKPRVILGDDVLIGSGSNVVKSITSCQLAFGSPAVIIRDRSPDERIFNP